MDKIAKMANMQKGQSVPNGKNGQIGQNYHAAENFRKW